MFKITDCSSFRKMKFFITSPFKKSKNYLVRGIFDIFKLKHPSVELNLTGFSITLLMSYTDPQGLQ